MGLRGRAERTSSSWWEERGPRGAKGPGSQGQEGSCCAPSFGTCVRVYTSRLQICWKLLLKGEGQTPAESGTSVHSVAQAQKPMKTEVEVVRANWTSKAFCFD